ncbi:unnamed protein product [Rhizoctonia solani]|uniref:Uncharacterized protein n=1 Tax=Rhizoctonia solani TaxID=456999 RepID=A0A8H3CZY1_9AGAM|nr:unnamed protein product [Rhizoctonia solani]
MSDYTDDEYEFTEFTEDELRAIDSTAEAALGTIWPPSSSDPQLATRLDPAGAEGDSPHSRKSSVFSTLELTEDELQLIDQSVERLVSDINTGSDSGGGLLTQTTRPLPSYLEVSLDPSIPSTPLASPAPTLGRSPSPSPPEMASLYSQFRASRNALSVSDLVAPVWCEVQFDYGLRGKRYLPPSLRPEVLETRSGKKIQVQREVAIKNDRVLKKGTAVHKKLEQEIRPIEVEITPKTREDAWGLKLLNMISNIRILIDEGCCREMPVMGFVHGHFVTGIIDEILRAPNAPQSTVPGGTSSRGQSSDHSSGLIHILDNKTRGVNSLPRTRDALQSRLQLMLYRRLLDTLLAPSDLESPQEGPINREGLSFPDIWMHHSLDPGACFSPSFLQESAVLIFSNGLGPAAKNSICLNDLKDVWNTIVKELAHTVGPGNQDGMVSNMLKLVYRQRGMSKKGSVYKDNSQGPSRVSSPETRHDEQRYSKKGRAESEDVELQRAIHESLRHSTQSDDLTTQDETSEVVGTQREESQGLIREAGDPIRAPGGRISPGDDLQRAIDESKKSHHEQVGREGKSVAFEFTLLTKIWKTRADVDTVSSLKVVNGLKPKPEKSHKRLQGGNESNFDQ